MGTPVPSSAQMPLLRKCSKPHISLQLCLVALLKRRKGNAVFGHHIGRAYALVHLARQNNTLCCFENTLLALFPQKPRFCGSPFGTQKLSSSVDGQAQRRYGGEAEQYVLSHSRLGRTRATVHRTADTRCSWSPR